MTPGMSDPFAVAVGMVLQRNTHTHPDFDDTRHHDALAKCRVGGNLGESVMVTWLSGLNFGCLTFIPRHDITAEWFIPD